MIQYRLPVSLTQIVLFVTVSILVYLGFATTPWALQEYRQGQDRTRLLHDIDQLKARYQWLQQMKAYVQTDAYIEDVARRELNLIKPGETAIMLLSPAPASAERPKGPALEADVPADALEVPVPTWRRWWGLFFGP